MARLRVHLIKNGNDFIEFEELLPNKVSRTTLPSDLLVPGDVVTNVQNKDIRGKNKKEIQRAISKCKNGNPMFIEVLKSGFDPDWLDPTTEVRGTLEMNFSKTWSKISEFLGDKSNFD